MDRAPVLPCDRSVLMLDGTSNRLLSANHQPPVGISPFTVAAGAVVWGGGGMGAVAGRPILDSAGGCHACPALGDTALLPLLPSNAPTPCPALDGGLAPPVWV